MVVVSRINFDEEVVFAGSIVAFNDFRNCAKLSDHRFNVD